MSVFILVGIFILLVVVMLYSLNQGLIPGFEFGESDPVTQYTETCLESVAKEGLSIMSVQGGYIDLPQMLSYDSGGYLNLGFKVPMWYYKGTDWKPSRTRMEKELSEYIVSNIGTCLNDYRAFRNEYDIEYLGEMDAGATIQDRSVTAELNNYMRLTPLGEERHTYIEEFKVDIETDFGRLYSLASEIMDHENTEYFLENYTDEMIACSDYLPYEGMEISCSPSVWRVDDMEDYTQQLVMHNLHFLQFVNTRFEETGMPYYDKQYKVYFTSNDYSDISVEPIYRPSWGMDFEVIPSENGVSKPFDFTINRYINTCVKIFHHKYSAYYPVMFQLTDGVEDFFFATPVIMKRGLPNRYQEVPLWPTEYDQAGSREYCSQTTEVTLYTQDSSGDMMTTPSLRQNRQNSLRVFVENALTGELMPGVNISYQCVMWRCPIGSTSYPAQAGLLTGAAPMLSARFPECTNGLVIAQRPGFLTARKQMTVSEETDGSQVTIEMLPLKEYDLSVRVVEDHNGLITERELEEDESVLITLKNDGLMYDKTIVYPSENPYFSNLSLIVGDVTYELDIKLVTDESYLGGLALNWTVPASRTFSNRHVIFYAIKKDPLVPAATAEEYQEIYEYAMKNSKDYPPRLR